MDNGDPNFYDLPKTRLLRIINDAMQTIAAAENGQYNEIIEDTVAYVNGEVKRWTDSLSYTELIYEVSALMSGETKAENALYDLIKINLWENKNESKE